MATKLYIESTGTAPATPTLQGGWSDTSQYITRPIGTTKAGSAATTINCADNSNVQADIIMYQGVSAPLTPGQTISALQSVSFVARFAETAAGNNLFLTWGVYIMNGNTLKFTLVGKRTDGTEVATSLTSRIDTTTSPGLTYSTVDGDRVVIEFGLGGDPTGGADHDGSASVGSDSGTDLTTDGTTTANNANLVINDTLTFTAETLTISVSDSTTMGESVTLTVSAPQISVSDSTTVTDTPTISIQSALTLSVTDFAYAVDNDVVAKHTVDDNAGFYINGGTASSGESSQQAGQGFSPEISCSITSVELLLIKVGTVTDNLIAKLWTGSPGNTLIATSDAIAGSSTTVKGFYTFTFSSPPSVTAGTTYYLTLERDGAIDAVNHVFWYGSNNRLPFVDSYVRTNNSWQTNTIIDQTFIFHSSSTPNPKLQEVDLINISDSTTVTDTPNKIMEINQPSVSDTVTMTDVAGRFDDTAIIYENVTVAITGGTPETLNISVSDSITVGESVQFQVVSYINVSDSTTLTDTPTIFLPYYTLSVTDQTTLTDTVTIRTFMNVNVSDTTTVTDTPTIFIPYYTPSVADSTTVGESVTMRVQSYINVSDSTTVTDAPTLSLTSYINVSDSTTLSESTTVFLPYYTISAADSTTVSDAVTMRLFSYVNVSDSTTVSESVTVRVSDLSINVSDSTMVTDTPGIFIPVLTFSVADSTTVTDTPSIFIPTLTLSVVDQTAVADAPTLFLPYYTISAVDQTTVTDTPSFFIPYYTIQVVDQTTVSENVSLVLVSPGSINVTDTTAVTDTPTIFLPYYTLSVTDSTTISEVVSIRVSDPQINVSDSTTLSESVALSLETPATGQGFSFVVFMD